MPKAALQGVLCTGRLVTRICQHQRLSVSCNANYASLCIVGSGPAGFYTAQKLLKSNGHVKIDIVDKLPVPFGLVRFGVAPDHPEVKNVIHGFTQTMLQHEERCRFIGNVNVGRDISITQLKQFYDIIVLSYGAEEDRKLNISGEYLHGVYSGKDFVGWYNGLPDQAELNPDLDIDTAVIMGQGNVALDIARILLTPVDELAKTDITEHAIETLRESRVERVHVVGRRGPLQVSFTIKEFRELTKIPHVSCSVPAELMKYINMNELPRPRKRLTELMKKLSQDSAVTKTKHCSLDFLLTPFELNGSKHVETASFYQNILEDNRAKTTDQIITLPCGLFIRSIGYSSIPIDGVPFNSKQKIIQNQRGRVEPGVYCSGWVKRGPTGVIADTMIDAIETADSILQDMNESKIRSDNKPDIMKYLHKQGIKTVDFKGWMKVDLEEVHRGESTGKLRVKVTDIQEIINIANKDS